MWFKWCSVDGLGDNDGGGGWSMTDHLDDSNGSYKDNDADDGDVVHADDESVVMYVLGLSK